MKVFSILLTFMYRVINLLDKLSSDEKSFSLTNAFKHIPEIIHSVPSFDGIIDSTGLLCADDKESKSNNISLKSSSFPLL